MINVHIRIHMVEGDRGRAFKGANEPAASPEGKIVGSRPGLRQTQSKLVARIFFRKLGLGVQWNV